MAANLKLSFEQIEQRMEEVRRLEARYRDLIEHSPEMIYQLNKAGRFVHVNKTGLDKLGYSLEEMLPCGSGTWRRRKRRGRGVGLSGAAGVEGPQHD